MEAVAPGDVIHLGPRDWQHSDGAQLRLQVERVRSDLSRYEDVEWVWIEGYDIDDAGLPVGWRAVKVRIAAIT
ncbi:MAG TPA: hypothetical protein VFE14_20715 [Micromonosporaceae bacterium]|nr:hypothetical protein [Micromonosporaceae bacterium]